jgi:hypothetical protein
MPWKSTPEIISTGIYRFTRNPMHLGMALIQLSIGIGLGSGWIAVLVPLSLLVIYAIAVRTKRPTSRRSSEKSTRATREPYGAGPSRVTFRDGTRPQPRASWRAPSTSWIEGRRR